MIKLLTVQQPWAQLIVLGQKRLENRPDATDYRGTLYIHSGLYFPQSEALLCYNEPFKSYVENPFLLEVGKVIGRVTLTGCTPVNMLTDEQKTDQELAFDNFNPGRYAWSLSDPVMFANPLRMPQGRPGIWEYPSFIADLLKVKTDG